MNFVFDIDGTLTPSRDKIDAYFEQFFLEFCSSNIVYLVTGSDFDKAREQLGRDILSKVEGFFLCSGNEFYRRTIGARNYSLEVFYELVYRNTFLLDSVEEEYLKQELKYSEFPIRTGNHIESRNGSVNFSIVGRNANKEERAEYVLWDKTTNERERVAERIMKMFQRLECVCGGETGIDIYAKGMNKSQVKEHIEGPIIFFGDRCEPGGNDYPLAKIADVVYNVKSWEETEYILRMKYGQVRGK